jgi:hypothetical protein
MSSSQLRLSHLVEPEAVLPITWGLDCPTRGVVILDAAIGPPPPGAPPLHWRAGDWTKPPLDIRLSDEGSVQSIQFVFQDEAVHVDDVVLPSNVESGVPAFDVDAWPSDRYCDARVSVRTLRLASGELYTTIGDAHPSRSVSVAWGLRFDFDVSDQLVGIALGPLTSAEWHLIDASSPLGDS